MSSKNHPVFSTLMNRFIQKILIMDRNEKLCYGVTLSQAYTIGAVYSHETLTMNELSQEMGLAVSTLTRIIDVLVRDNIICREQSATDRRKVMVKLTEKGNELAENLKGCGEQFWQRIFAQLPDTKKKEINEDLILLLRAIEKAESTCCPKN